MSATTFESSLSPISTTMSTMSRTNTALDSFSSLFTNVAQHQNDDHSESSSSSASSPSLPSPSYCCLSSQDTSTQVPTNDVARLSFYLRCCVIGCGLARDIIPTELIDFANAPSLPSECQSVIYKLTLEGFAFWNLCGRVIFIDTDRTVLPTGISTMIFKSKSSEFIEAMHRLGLAYGLPPITITESVIICSSEWVQEYYTNPLTRYYTSNCTSNTSPLMARIQNNAVESTVVHEEYQQHPFLTSPAMIRKKKGGFEMNNMDDLELDISQDDCEQTDIPMVDAVLIMDDAEMADESLSTEKETAAVPPLATTDVVSASLLIAGQHVRFIGLEMEEMNDCIGIVQERRGDTVIVDVEDHECQYSVRLHNLMILVPDEAVSSTTATTTAATATNY